MNYHFYCLWGSMGGDNLLQINFARPTPMQTLFPSPKGRNAHGFSLCNSSVENLSGSNRSGSENISGSLWMASTGISTMVSFSMIIFEFGTQK
uniref:Uncharacterized protein n=1 Tax=Megaselia scalaris TaxID=36166 RepID=T1GJP1_MEGSC